VTVTVRFPLLRDAAAGWHRGRLRGDTEVGRLAAVDDDRADQISFAITGVAEPYHLGGGVAHLDLAEVQAGAVGRHALPVRRAAERDAQFGGGQGVRAYGEGPGDRAGLRWRVEHRSSPSP